MGGSSPAVEVGGMRRCHGVVDTCDEDPEVGMTGDEDPEVGMAGDEGERFRTQMCTTVNHSQNHSSMYPSRYHRSNPPYISSYQQQ